MCDQMRHTGDDAHAYVCVCIGVCVLKVVEDVCFKSHKILAIVEVPMNVMLKRFLVIMLKLKCISVHKYV